MPAAEDIRVARPRERLDVIARLTLFRDRVRAEHRAQLVRCDAVREAQTMRLVIGPHCADAAIVHAVDEPAVLIAVQKLQNAAQQRGIRLGLRVKILEEDRHIAAADHTNIRDLVGGQAVAVHEGLLRFQDLHRQLPGFQLDRAAADGALRMAVGEDGHFCARTARRGAGRGENAAQHDALALRERLQHGCEKRFHTRSSILIVRMPSRLVCGR